MDGGKVRRNARESRILELLHKSPMSVSEIGKALKIAQSRVWLYVGNLKVAGVIWPNETFYNGRRLEKWTAKRPTGMSASYERHPEVLNRPKVTFKRVVSVDWKSPKRKTGDIEADWLTDTLDLWGRWMRQKDYSALNYPPVCTVLQGGWLVRESEELYDEADMRLILATDAAVESLPQRERAAVWTAQGLCDSPEGAWIVDAMQYARLLILRHLGQKGFGPG